MGAVSDRTREAALREIRDAHATFDDALEWFLTQGDQFDTPLAVEVWVFDAAMTSVILVDHRWRGWVPPGGTVERGELPRDAAVREVFEETGLHVELFPRPAAAAIRSYRSGWAATLGLSFVAVANPSDPLSAEDGQPARWIQLTSKWNSAFDDDRGRMLSFVERHLSEP
jgi:8-oxo-dGTP diphosphatase